MGAEAPIKSATGSNGGQPGAGAAGAGTVAPARRHRGFLRGVAVRRALDEVLGGQRVASPGRWSSDPGLRGHGRGRPRPGHPASTTHLVQEAHEVAKDGAVVFRKALQDLAAVGHPQAALHTCDGTRVPPEPFLGGGHGRGGGRRPRHPARSSHLLPAMCHSPQPPPSPVSDAPFCTCCSPSLGKLQPRGQTACFCQ